MKLVMDGRYIKVDFHDGISRYITSLINASYDVLEDYPGLELEVIISDEKQADFFSSEITTHLFNAIDSPRELVNARRLNALNADVIFSPMQFLGSAPKSQRNFKQILTIHDLIYYVHPETPHFLPEWQKKIWRLYHKSFLPQRYFLSRADKVVTISETTRQLMYDHNLASGVIDIIGNAPSISDDVLEQFQQSDVPAAKRKNIVYMGAFIPYKNASGIIAVANLMPDYIFHLLSKISEEDREYLAGLSVHKNIVFHNGVSDKQYYDAVTNATALMSLSRSEGYGLPLVESMSLGTPVVVSDIPIFHEVAGNAALYVNPDVSTYAHRKAAADAIYTLENQDFWNKMSVRGKKRARDFTWEESARSLIEIASLLDHDS